jgi:hypothetical protein
MADSGTARPLTGWQRAHVLSAAQYVRELLQKAPEDAKARSVYDALLEVLEPTRRLARQHRERALGSVGSMWEQRSGRDRRAGGERRMFAIGPPDGRERRFVQRRSGRERRNA